MRAWFVTFVRALASHDGAILELMRVADPAELEGMIEQTAELAKLGYTAKQMAQIVEAAEKCDILAFEYGTIRRVGRARTLREMYGEGS